MGQWVSGSEGCLGLSGDCLEGVCQTPSGGVSGGCHHTILPILPILGSLLGNGSLRGSLGTSLCGSLRGSLRGTSYTW